jgi:transcriptional regulator with XRE-family HTH domain
MGADVSAQEFQKGLAQVVKALLKERGMTPAALAKAKNLDPSLFTRVLKPTKTMLHTRSLIDLARGFDLDIFDFFERIRVQLKGPREPSGHKRLTLDADLTDDEFQRVSELLAGRKK